MSLEPTDPNGSVACSENCSNAFRRHPVLTDPLMNGQDDPNSRPVHRQTPLWPGTLLKLSAGCKGRDSLDDVSTNLRVAIRSPRRENAVGETVGHSRNGREKQERL